MKSPDNQSPPVVFVVDDDSAVRESLDSLIRSIGLRVETFSSAQEFLRHKLPDAPACLILDIRMPGQSGLDLKQELAAKERTTPITFITGHGDIPMSVRAMKAGAVEFLTKPFRDRDLLDAIHQAILRDQAALERRAELADLHTRYELVTPREREVTRLVVGGKLNKQIAAVLGTTEITVKIQRGRVMKKMKARRLPTGCGWQRNLESKLFRRLTHRNHVWNSRGGVHLRRSTGDKYPLIAADAFVAGSAFGVSLAKRRSE